MKYQAWLWDGSNRMKGNLYIAEKKIVFEPLPFQKGNLQLEVPFEQIISFEGYFLYQFSRDGIAIKSKNGKEDLFILEETEQFKSDFTKALKQKR